MYIKKEKQKIKEIRNIVLAHNLRVEERYFTSNKNTILNSTGAIQRPDFSNNDQRYFTELFDEIQDVIAESKTILAHLI